MKAVLVAAVLALGLKICEAHFRTTLAMTQHDPIDHHYLPVFYLNRWRGPDNRVVRYFRPHDVVVAKGISPTNTGFEPRLYTLEGLPPTMQQAIEREFMAPVVDDRAAEALEILITGNSAALTAKVREAWTRFLCSLQLRDPQSLQEIQNLSLETMRANMSKPDPEYDATKKDIDPATPFEYVEQNTPHLLDNLGKTLLPELINHRKIGTHIMRMHWWPLDLSSGGVSLLTADRPVLRYEPLGHDNCLITLPLSPSFLFVAANRPNIVDQLLRTHTKAYIAKKANKDVVIRATKHVYGSTAEHRRLVEKCLVRRDQQPYAGVMGLTPSG